ncbi:hydrolase [Streptomyces sp. WAC 06738]|uniref:phytase n=1 Tax=Streptomyces sp. WAC 06738 TaxID=2203210 RepID=UPI000F720740|nr:phytase [Streptomyces sp. WAC 06738]AZM44598.1 hydrolase [Streptomyces sp. WAC 06738]
MSHAPKALRKRCLTIAAAAVVTAVVATPAHAEPTVAEVGAKAETPTLFDDAAGGEATADDPAIWRNPDDPAESLVLGTAKVGGLRVYDLSAREVQSLPAPKAPGAEDEPGRINNVDVIDGANLAIATDRGRDKLVIYSIDRDRAEGPVKDVTAEDAAPYIFSADQDEVNEQATAYGLASWKDSRTGRIHAVVTQELTNQVALLELTEEAGGTYGYRKIRTAGFPTSFTLPDGTTWTPCEEPGEQPYLEGMRVDPANGMLYAGQEDVGVWRMRADLTGEPTLIDKVRDYGTPATWDPDAEECVPGEDSGFGGNHLTADVEGITLIDRPGGGGHLVVSSQGDSTFAMYDRDPAKDNAYVKSFRVVAGPGTGAIDGAEGTDSLEIVNQSFGSAYPQGLAVIQDETDTPTATGDDGEPREGTNYKYVDLRDVATATGLKFR